MFSVLGTTQITFTFGFRAASARMTPSMVAPPAMSYFIFSMPSEGLMEMPPESKVMPLPTSPSTGVAGAPGGSYFMTMRARGQHAGRHAIARLIHQLASKVLRLTQDATLSQRALQRGLIGLALHHDR